MKTKYHSTPSTANARRGNPAQSGWILRKWWAQAVGGCLFAFIGALSPSSSEAQCPHGWDVTGNWGLKQSNQAALSSLALRGGWTTEGGVVYQRIRGRASYASGRGKIDGYVIARVSGNNLHLEISWDNGLTGIYDGTIGQGGKLTGTSYERGSPSTKVGWFSDRPMICRSQPPPDPKRL